MTERLTGGEEDAWAELEHFLLSDDAFARQVNAANDELDMADLSEPVAVSQQEGGPYRLEDITDVAKTLHEAFTLACQASGVDIYGHEQDEDDYDSAGLEVVYACHALREQIKPNDVVAASRGIYATVDPDNDTAMMFTLDPKDKLVGRFVGPIICRLPDEAYFIAGNGEQILPVGVGLELSQATILEESGETSTAHGRIAVVLGITGLRLEKFHFRSDLE